MRNGVDLLSMSQSLGHPEVSRDILLDDASYIVDFDQDAYANYLLGRGINDDRIGTLSVEMHRFPYKPIAVGTYNFRETRLRMSFEPIWNRRAIFDPNLSANRVLLHETEHFIQDAKSSNGVRDMNLYRQLGGLAGLALYRRLRHVPTTPRGAVIDAALHGAAALAGTYFLNPLEISAEAQSRLHLADENLHFLTLTQRK
jgi:hypothetical protein